MDENLNATLNLLFRWIHVVAGIVWIGHLYFFNFVNAQLVKTYDADSKKKVVPELMPRALFWFRMGAAVTWVTGILLAGLVYYMGGAMVAEGGTLGSGALTGIGLGSLVIGFAVYDLLWKSALAKNETVAAVVSYSLLTIAAFGYAFVMNGRAMFIHLGMLLGTIMAANVWMRIWPSQRKIIAGIKGTAPAPDAAVAAMAGLRSKHNTYMSVPLVLFMISNHYPNIYGSKVAPILALGFLALGWIWVKRMYTVSASAGPAQF